MILSQEAMPLIKKLQNASEKESIAIKFLLEYMKTDNIDPKIAEKLTEDMEAAHAEKMDIRDQLQPFRLDK